MAGASASQVASFYQFVIDDVIDNLREAFLEEGVDEQVLLDIKSAWSRKIEASGVLSTSATSSDEATTSNNTTPVGKTNAKSNNANNKNKDRVDDGLPAVPAKNKKMKLTQVDGIDDISSDEDDAGDDEDEFRDQYGEIDDLDLNMNDEELPSVVEDEVREEPLNSGDDVSEEESDIIFDSENVIVCQYDKITRSRNRWKFQLKDGIMNISGKDYIYHKAVGDAEW